MVLFLIIIPSLKMASEAIETIHRPVGKLLDPRESFGAHWTRWKFALPRGQALSGQVADPKTASTKKHTKSLALRHNAGILKLAKLYEVYAGVKGL